MEIGGETVRGPGRALPAMNPGRSDTVEPMPPSPGSAALTARSALFIRGDEPDTFDQAAGSEADLLVYDLEDAVAPTAKVEARRSVAAWLLGNGPAAVRVNATGCPEFPDDLAAVRHLPGLCAVVVPKAEEPEALSRVGAGLPERVPVIAMIESALGLSRIADLAAVDGVGRLAFGQRDFSVDIGAADDHLATVFARSQIVVASRAAGLVGPLDGLTTDILEPSVTHGDAKQSRRMGFTGKFCIHPHQVEVINDAFMPTRQEVAWAQVVVEAAGEGGVVIVAGHVVDPPVVDRARRILAMIGTQRLGED